MNTRPSNRENTPAHPALDAALRRLGSATPDPQMQERVLRRLRTATMHNAAARQNRSWGWPRLAAAALAGSFACTLMVVGSISHSHAVAQQSPPPMLQLVRPQNGVSTADASHIAAHPVPAPPGKGRAQEHMHPGRASVSPGAHADPGLALPAKVSNH
jgi:hypothetical protein